MFRAGRLDCDPARTGRVEASRRVTPRPFRMGRPGAQRRQVIEAQLVGPSIGQIFRTVAKPQSIVAARPLNDVQHRVRAKSSARDLPR